MPKPSVLRAQQRYWERKQSGICVYSACGLPSYEGRVYCKQHWQERREFDKMRCQRDKGKRTAAHLRWHNKTKLDPTRIESQREYKLRIRKEVINAYGGFCKCCGENELVFLDIDHINNDGAKHRKETGYIGLAFYLWLRRENFPKDFQILCKNCNWAKFVLGGCPHERTLARSIGPAA